MKVTYRFKSYDKKLQLTPSFAVVTAQGAILRFGVPLQGDPRVLTLDASPGDMVRWQHKARTKSSPRNPRADAPKRPETIDGYGIVQPDGSIKEIQKP